MKLTSPAFKDHAIIPSRYTCEGDNVSPPLEISEVPAHAKSLVLLMDDPDVPKTLRVDGMWDHWVLFNLPPTLKKIAEGTSPGTLGKNTSGKNKYEGACPPDREHRYFFRLYALDVLLSLHAGATKKEVEGAIKGHILAEAKLMGRYEKAKGY